MGPDPARQPDARREAECAALLDETRDPSRRVGAGCRGRPAAGQTHVPAGWAHGPPLSDLPIEVRANRREKPRRGFRERQVFGGDRRHGVLGLESLLGAPPIRDLGGQVRVGFGQRASERLAAAQFTAGEDKPRRQQPRAEHQDRQEGGFRVLQTGCPRRRPRAQEGLFGVDHLLPDGDDLLHGAPAAAIQITGIERGGPQRAALLDAFAGDRQLFVNRRREARETMHLLRVVGDQSAQGVQTFGQGVGGGFKRRQKRFPARGRVTALAALGGLDLEERVFNHPDNLVGVLHPMIRRQKTRRLHAAEQAEAAEQRQHECEGGGQPPVDTGALPERKTDGNLVGENG